MMIYIYSSAGIQAQTQSYNQDISPLPKPDSPSDDQDETLTEVILLFCLLPKA